MPYISLSVAQEWGELVASSRKRIVFLFLLLPAGLHCYFDWIKQVTMAGLVAGAMGGLLVYLVARSIYRLNVHPLGSFPGPKLVAVARGYAFYSNVIKRGAFIWKLERLHEIYGEYPGHGDKRSII